MDGIYWCARKGRDSGKALWVASLERRATLNSHDSINALAATDGKRSGEKENCPEDLSEVMDYSSYDLRTTIRLIVLSGECRRIDIQRGSRRGSIYINGGEIYRVVTTDGDGDEAFFDIMSWTKAIHTDSLQPEPLERNVRISTDVLLDVSRRQASTPK